MKKYLHKFMYALLSLHNNVLSGYPVQIVLFCLILLGFSSGNTKAVSWLTLGIISYVILMIKNHPKKEGLKKIKKLYKENGVLPFLTGFNYSLALGPITLLLDLLLISLKKSEDSSRSN